MGLRPRGERCATQWQRVILIQDGKDTGFTQAPFRVGQDPIRTNDTEEYKGHVLEVLIEVSPTENIGNAVHKLLLKCYSQGSTVPAPDTLRYTLGKFPSNLVWTQEQIPEQSPSECKLRDRNVPVLRRQTRMDYEERLHHPSFPSSPRLG